VVTSNAAEGLTLEDGDIEGLTDGETDGDLLGLTLGDREGDKLELGLSDGEILGETEELGDALGEIDGEILAEGLAKVINQSNVPTYPL
jgi:hypothetical protein